MEILMANQLDRQDFHAWQMGCIQHIESVLSNLLTPAAITLDGRAAPTDLIDVMRYVTLGGGKRLRPLLVLATFEALSASHQAPSDDVLRSACATELIHTYSLTHDDLPCMDDDVLRRGKPTAHIQFNEAMAVLAGDALQALAFEWLTTSNPDIISYETQVKLCATLAKAAGAAGMTGGQAIDLLNVSNTSLSREDLQTMHLCKTGALLEASVQMGALCAGVGCSTALSEFATTLGLAFQVIDDILDVTSDTHTLGKSTGKDAAFNKPTYVSIVGLDESRGFASYLHDKAITALNTLAKQQAHPVDTHILTEITNLVVLRTC